MKDQQVKRTAKKSPAPVIDPATGEILTAPFTFDARSAAEYDELLFTDPRPWWNAAPERTDKRAKAKPSKKVEQVPPDADDEKEPSQ